MFTWSALTTPWDGVGYGAACLKLPSGRLVIGGASGDGLSSILVSDDGGATWTPVSTPLDAGGINGLAYSQPLGRLVAVGNQSGGGPTTVAHSDDDGATWSDDGDPFAGVSFAQCVAWDDGQALFVAGGYSTGAVLITSPDGLAWTPATTPFDGDGVNSGFISGIIYSASAGTWVAVGKDLIASFTEMTSPDATTWTQQTGPFDDAFFNSGVARNIVEDTVNGQFIACGSSSGAVNVFANSPDLTTWTVRSTAADGGDAQQVKARAGRTLSVVLSVSPAIFESADGGSTWTGDPSSPLVQGYGLAFLDNTHALAVGGFGGATAALGVAIVPRAEKLYGAKGTNASYLGTPITTSDLYLINPDTGVATPIGPIGFAVAALAVRDSSTLWGVTAASDVTAPHNLIIIDTATGAGTLVGPLGTIDTFDIAVVAGVLYEVHEFGGPNTLATIDTATGLATDVGTFSATFRGGVSVKPGDADMYFIPSLNEFGTPGQLYSLATDATETLEGTITGYPSNPGLFNEMLAMDADPDTDTLIWALVAQDDSADPPTVHLVTIDASDIANPVATLIAATDPGMDALAWGAAVIPPPPGPIRRRNPVVQARILVTDLNSVTTTWLDHAHLLTATITANLGLPWQIAASVRSGDRAVRTIFGLDGDPLVAQSNRLVYVFLREAPAADPSAPWVCRASGILMSPQDQGDSDIGTTHFTAYDPWQYCMGRPCYLDSSGTPIGPDGRLFPATPGNEIAYTLIQDTIASEGIGIFADIPNSFGGTIHWDGTNETTPTLDFKVQQGTSLGEALTQLASSGNDITGTSQCIDIIFEPIYDPLNRPGFVSQVSIYDLAGVERPEAPMAWARFTRSVKTADRQHDGTPGAFINVVQYVAGQGVALALAPVLTSFASVLKYYPYWAQQWFPAQPIAQAVEALAVQALQLHKQGKRTFLVDPDPLRAGLPFRDYAIGDRIPVFTSNALRVGSSGFQRVETIPVVIGPDGVTHVEQLLTSPDWPENEGS